MGAVMFRETGSRAPLIIIVYSVSYRATALGYKRESREPI